MNWRLQPQTEETPDYYDSDRRILEDRSVRALVGRITSERERYPTRCPRRGRTSRRHVFFDQARANGLIQRIAIDALDVFANFIDIRKHFVLRIIRALRHLIDDAHVRLMRNHPIDLAIFQTALIDDPCEAV